MYSLHLSATSISNNSEYTKNQSYQLFMIVKRTLKEDAIKMAETVLAKENWINIKLQQISEVSKEKENNNEITGDYYLYVFDNNEQNKLNEYRNDAKALHDKLEQDITK